MRIPLDATTFQQVAVSFNICCSTNVELFIIDLSFFFFASGTLLLNTCRFREEAYFSHLTRNPPRGYTISVVSVQKSPFDNFHGFHSVIYVPLQYSSLKVEASKLLTFPSTGTLLYPSMLTATKTSCFTAVRWSVTLFTREDTTREFLKPPAYT